MPRPVLPNSSSIWSGCHGVRTTGASLDIGVASGEPIATATLDVAPVTDDTEGDLVWTQRAEVVADDVVLEIDRSLRRRADGTLVLTSSRGPAVQVNPVSGAVTVSPGDDAAQRQLVASFALPLILHERNALLLHGAGCALGDQTVLVCGESGAGKSSVLVRLLDGGWQAVSEDVCTIDVQQPAPLVWPGPPWVRLARARPGPHGSRSLFDAPDKTAWDIADRQITRPHAVTAVVLLDPPGGDAAEVTRVARDDAIGALAPHTVWLQAPEERGRRLFSSVVNLAAKVPVFRVRLPRHEGWADDVPDVFASAALVS